GALDLRERPLRARAAQRLERPVLPGQGARPRALADQGAVSERAGILPAALAIMLATFALPARAAEADDLFKSAAEPLRRGEFGAAIDAFEALADQGLVHPDASFDRGLAYVMRVKAHAERPGDLGRAAAAFEEALLLRPGDEEADRALDL